MPTTVVCTICEKAERSLSEEREVGEVSDELSVMECGLCWDIVHAECLKEKYENLTSDGIVNEDLPNSWECAKCCHEGKNLQLKVGCKLCST